jgi:predicted metalloprotease with PDZ domain
VYKRQSIYSQITQNENYQFYVDLNNVEDDRLTIELITPQIAEDKVLYRFPAMVPGTYKVYDFGRFISDLKAFDESGNELSVSKGDVNTWEISDATRLYKITYKADDTFQDTTGVSVFEPVGTSIEEGKVFVFNNQGFFGYLDGYIRNDYVLNITKPEGFFGSTSLEALERTDTQEILISPDYHDLVDNPILFNIPDTASINFEEAKVLISVYSPGKGMTAKDIADNDKPLLEAIRNYLGGTLPTDKYTFLYYFSNLEGGSGSFGALEHKKSSFFYMPDVPAQAKFFMMKQLQSTAAHEFYHIVTPLNLHSEEIGNFDFNNPVMSKHLWLYEGVTEYKSEYIQLVEGLITLDEFADKMEEKLNAATSYNDTLAFTELSKRALDIHENQYLNVYQKGALIGLCLDILIREESNGQMSLQDVINTLTAKYGQDRPFKDDELFGEIETLTSPKVGEFLEKYVGGPNRIPYEEIFAKVGITVAMTPYQTINAGGLAMGFNQVTYRLKIVRIESEDNNFFKELGIKEGDELISFNGQTISFQNYKNIFGSAKKEMKKGDDFELIVARFDKGGIESKKTLKAKISDTKTSYEFKLSIADKPDDKQLRLKNAWLGK